MKIGIIGTRGIPNNYGGFEQCAEYLAVGLVKRGFEVTVYNSHNHDFQGSEWKGVTINHQYDPEDKIGTAGQFIYDLNCILDSRKQNFDIILQLGYTSSSVWSKLLPTKKSVVTTNMDGLEWKRSKFSKRVQKFLLFAEKLAVKNSDYLISDSIGIQSYLQDKYGNASTYIPYGADLFNDPDVAVLKNYELEPYAYDMLVARLEPENSIEIILDGVVASKQERPFLVVGKHASTYGVYLKNKYKEYPTIRFVGGIYDINILNNIRSYSNLYFHGHTVGGTNPSLLEAMASNSLVCAHDNPFNRHILGEDGLYFTSSTQVATCLREVQYNNPLLGEMIQNNRRKIQEIYSWETIVQQYATHFKEISRTKLKSERVYQ